MLRYRPIALSQRTRSVPSLPSQRHVHFILIYAQLVCGPAPPHVGLRGRPVVRERATAARRARRTLVRADCQRLAGRLATVRPASASSLDEWQSTPHIAGYLSRRGACRSQPRMFADAWPDSADYPVGRRLPGKSSGVPTPPVSFHPLPPLQVASPGLRARLSSRQHASANCQGTRSHGGYRRCERICHRVYCPVTEHTQEDYVYWPRVVMMMRMQEGDRAAEFAATRSAQLAPPDGPIYGKPAGCPLRMRGSIFARIGSTFVFVRGIPFSG